MGITDLFWLFLIVSSLQPLLRKKVQELNRRRMIAQIEQQRGSLRSAVRPLVRVPHAALEALLPRLRDAPDFRPGVASIWVLIVVVDFRLAAAADMRSRQAALFDQVVANGPEMFSVAVL